MKTKNKSAIGRVITACGMAAAAMLAACGGGGDDDDRAAPALTTAQQQRAAASGRAAVAALWAAQATTLQLKTSGQSQATVPAAGTAHALSVPGGTTAPASADVQPLWLFPCRSGGSVDVNVTSLVPLEVTTVFLSCADTAAVFNGTLTASVAAAQPDAVLRLDTSARAFEVSVGPLSQQLDGSTRLAITSVAPFTLQASSPALLATTRVAGIEVASASLSGLDASVAFNAQTITSSIRFSAAGQFAGVGQATLQVQTAAPLVTTLGALFPAQGQLRVVENGVTVTTITAQGETVLVEIDLDGDGVIDERQELAVGDLAGQLQA